MSRRFLVLAVAAAALVPAAPAAAGGDHPPVVSFAWAPVAPKSGDTLTLTATASDQDNDLALVRWDLDGDDVYETLGTTATVRLDRGPHTIGVRATDIKNHSTTVKRVVTVANAAPSAASFTWSPSAPHSGQSVTLTGSGSDPEGDALSYAWDLDGNGTYETSVARPSASFVRGARKVGLRVSDPSGASFTTTKTIDVGNAAPSGDFTWDAAVESLSNTPVHLSAVNVADADDGAAGVAVAWDLDDDGSWDATGSEVDAVFRTPGAQMVSLKLTDAQGSVVVVRHGVDVANRPPVAAFDVSSGSPRTGEELTLTSRGTDPDGGTLQLSSAWDLDGDGEFDDATGDVAHASFLAGPHTVRLRVTDGDGASTVAERTLDVTTPITVLAAPATFLQPSATATSPLTVARPRPMAPFPVVRLRGRLARSGVFVELLSIKNVPSKARVAATCKGAGCRGLDRALKRGGKVAKLIAGRRLGAGAVLEIRITQPGAIGKVVRFTFRRNRAPLRRDGCLTSAGKPGPCA